MKQRVIHWAAWPAMATLPLFWGCAAPAGGQGGSSSHQAEVDRLRAQSDRAFAPMEGRPTAPLPESPPTAAATPQPAAGSPLPSKSRPEWVGEGVSANYPSARYLTGMGSCKKGAADDYAALTTAEDRARSELAKTIRVRVKSEFDSATQLVTQVRAGAASSSTDTVSVANQISSQTDLVLRGVQIADRWYDPKADTYWALAVLDRDTTGANILDRARRMRQEVDRDRDLGLGYRKDGKSWQAASYLNRALKNSLSILSYRAYLRIIAPSLVADPALAPDPAMESLWRESALAAEELRAAVIVYVQTDGRRIEDSAAASELSGAMRGLGLKLVAVEAADAGASYAAMKGRPVADLQKQFAGRAGCLVLADFAAKEITSQKLGSLLVHFYRARSDAVIVDLTSGRQVASVGFDWSPETQTGNADTARAAEGALLAAAKLVADKLKAELAADLNLMPEPTSKKAEN